MKTKIWLIIFIAFCTCFLSSSTNGRLLVVEYSHSTKIEGMPSRITVKAELVATNTNSIYEMAYAKMTGRFDEEDNDQGQTYVTMNTLSNPIIYKDYQKDVIYSTERIGFRPFLVKDSPKIFNWSLTKKYKQILSYRCQEARLKYRGRTYTAYFTPDIQVQAGPWKFSGLPGVILEIKSDDGAFEIEATRMQILNKTLNIKNPYSKIDEAISWDHFLLKYREKYNELLFYVNESNGSSAIPKRKIEILIED